MFALFSPDPCFDQLTQLHDSPFIPKSSAFHISGCSLHRKISISLLLLQCLFESIKQCIAWFICEKGCVGNHLFIFPVVAVCPWRSSANRKFVKSCFLFCFASLREVVIFNCLYQQSRNVSSDCSYVKMTTVFHIEGDPQQWPERFPIERQMP